MPPIPVPAEDVTVAVASSALSWGYVTRDDRPPGWAQNLPTPAEAWELALEEYAEREFFESEGVDWDADDVQLEEGAGQRFALVSQRIARGLADPGACSVVDELVDLDPLLLPEDERIDLVVALEKQLNRVQAAYQRALYGAVVPLVPLPQVPRGASKMERERVALAKTAREDELALALRRPLGSMTYQVRRARKLATGYLAARDAMAAGEMTWQQCTVLLEETAACPSEKLPQVLDRVLPHAGSDSLPQFKARIRRAMVRLVPDLAEAERAASLAGKSVLLVEDANTEGGWDNDWEVDDPASDPGPDAGTVVRSSSLIIKSEPLQARRMFDLVKAEGMRQRGIARGDVKQAVANAQAEHKRAVKQFGECSAQALNALAAVQAAKDERDRVYRIRMGAWLVDGMENLLEHGSRAVRGGQPVTAHGREVLPVVVVDLATALGLAKNPVEVPGFGSMPAAVLGELSLRAKEWTVAVTDQTGAPLATVKYKPTAAIWRHLEAVRPRCVHAHCTQPFHWSQGDHTVPYDHENPEAGGPTDTHNLCPRCGIHHALKTCGLLDSDVLDDGSVEIITRSGRRYRTPPPRLLADEADPPENPWATPKPSEHSSWGDPDQPPPF
jgi:hypothetical protein